MGETGKEIERRNDKDGSKNEKKSKGGEVTVLFRYKNPKQNEKPLPKSSGGASQERTNQVRSAFAKRLSFSQ
jgi:hypothetical protein